MGWIIKMARVGNAKPVYCVQRVDAGHTMAKTVKDVAGILGRPANDAGVRIACKEARETGRSEFLI